MPSKLVLGIDGGGTKTAVSIARCHGKHQIEVLGRGIAGGSNILSVGEQDAIQNLDLAVNQALAAADLKPETIETAVLGMAGSSSPDVRDTINCWAEKRRLANEIKIIGDIDPVLTAGTPNNWGLAMIVGTGTIVKGVNPAGRSEILGGWGRWYGDQGGGYDLGREALVACVHHADGIGPKTKLLAAITTKLKITEARDIIVELERSGDVRGEIAALAPLVPELANKGDAVAAKILTDAVDHILALCCSLSQRLDLSPGFPIALAGGVICHSKIYRETFETKLKTSELSASTLTLVPNPVQGCLILAA